MSSKMAAFPLGNETGFDYAIEAELFPTRRRNFKSQHVGYRRFACASEAIRFAMEELPCELLAGAYLEVDEGRYDSQGIRRLYESDAYPLTRRRVGSP